MAIKVEFKWNNQEDPSYQGLDVLKKCNFLERIFKKDGSLWSSDRSHIKIAENRLGWLELPGKMLERSDELNLFSRERVYKRYKYAVHLGMGGSSLAPEVLFLTFGSAPGFPEFFVLDSTDPVQINDVMNHIDLLSTIFIVASKSGTTVETDSLARFFYDKMKHVDPASYRDHFVAITDPGTVLNDYSEKNYSKTFLSESNVGGRYSALSYFGIVPFAFMGHDIKRFLKKSFEIHTLCKSGVLSECPALKVGAFLGELASMGINKLTVQTSSSVESLGNWIEQLIAESTGKEGKGILPVVNEELTAPEYYSSDRVFIYVKVSDDVEIEKEEKMLALEMHGYPVIRIQIDDIFELSGVFYMWEVATAAAAVILGIDPFDEPNVQESKDNTKKVLKEFMLKRQISFNDIPLFKNNVTIFGSVEVQPFQSELDVIRALFQMKSEGDYLAIMAYLPRCRKLELEFQRLQTIIRDKLRIPVTIGFGPRYLHSTGQFHKGGTPNGLFLQFVHTPELDFSIPGEEYTFANLFMAQAIGDYLALKSKGKPILSIQLNRDYLDEVAQLTEWILKEK